jgi:hypothetical protein
MPVCTVFVNNSWGDWELETHGPGVKVLKGKLEETVVLASIEIRSMPESGQQEQDHRRSVRFQSIRSSEIMNDIH